MDKCIKNIDKIGWICKNNLGNIVLKAGRRAKLAVKTDRLFSGSGKCEELYGSRKIGLLEKNLGVRLLERHNRTFTLTEAGEYFYKESTKISRSVAKMMKETERIGKSEDQRR